MSVKHGAKLLLLDLNDNVLMLRRSETHPHIPFTADLPGGEVEPEETPAAAVCRETFEETRCVVSENDVTLVGERKFGAFGKEFDLYLYVAHVPERPDVAISWEHDQYSWLPVTEVKDLDDGFQPLLDKYLEERDV
jgi:8-oxo-dGTP pyrophosphatase MutT (NUDIX family)